LDYPGVDAEFAAWFPDEEGLLGLYLEWLRWPDSFRCPRFARAGRAGG
jgi:hypothetical protein